MRIGASAFLLASLTCVFGEELETPGEEVLREIAESSGAGRYAKWAGLLNEAADLHAHPASAAEAEALRQAAAAALATKSERVLLAAIRAVGRMRHVAVDKEIAVMLRPLKPTGVETERLLAAIEAAGRMHTPPLLTPLSKQARQGEHMVAAEQAWKAIGAYERTPTDLRRAAADKALEGAESLARGSGKKKRARWRRLRAPALRTLQRLIGRKLNTVAQFADWWRIARKQEDPWAQPKD
ncbi:MAG: hypothetical protein V3T86_15955 [Planctomycetota bacterium]